MTSMISRTRCTRSSGARAGCGANCAAATATAAATTTLDLIQRMVSVVVDGLLLAQLSLEKNGVIGETILVSERQRGKHGHQKLEHRKDMFGIDCWFLDCVKIECLQVKCPI